MASGVRLIGLKVMGDNGGGSTSAVLAALEFAVVNKAALGIDVINLSLGHPICEAAATDRLVQAVEDCVQAGIVVVVSAGNNGMKLDGTGPGFGGILSPGNAPSAITVGATRTQNTLTQFDDRLAPYSSRGPSWYDAFAKPDLSAPGHQLPSLAAKNGTLYTTYPTLHQGNDSIRLCGTSMAAGVVSGSVALVLETHRALHPDALPLTPSMVKAMLMYSAVALRQDDGTAYMPIEAMLAKLGQRGSAVHDTPSDRGADRIDPDSDSDPDTDGGKEPRVPGLKTRPPRGQTRPSRGQTRLPPPAERTTCFIR